MTKTINKQNSPLFQKGLQKWQMFVRQYTGPYNLSGSVYKGMNQKVQFVCPVHGLRHMDAKNLINGKGCVLCYREQNLKRPRITKGVVIKRFLDTHGDKYDYSLVQYSGQQSEVDIICPRHGIFKQKPEYHWTGSGCPSCYHEDVRGASQRLQPSEFEQRAKQALPEHLYISAEDYTNCDTKVDVNCTLHDKTIRASPRGLMAGENPCPSCNHMKSAAEEEVAKFLGTFTEVRRRDRRIIAPKELDIYLPEHNLAIEYCGMYWHSHKNKEDETKNKLRHAEKHQMCKDRGIRLITLFETDWLERKPVIKRLLRAATNNMRGRLMARKCEIREPSSVEAKEFYERYHPQGGAGYGKHYALYWKGKMVACMRFTYGGNDRGSGAKGRQWTLSRYATRLPVAGAASRLFKAFVQSEQPEKVKSFSDNRLFSGGMYEQLGFLLEEEVAPDYQVWSHKIGLRPKPHYQRRVLQKRLDEHGIDCVFDPANDPRTERDMTYLMGARRIYDCGKKRWLWTPPPEASQ